MKTKILTNAINVLKYIQRVGIALSVLLNVILGGKSNQTFSARNWQRKRDRKWHLCDIIDILFWFDTNHSLTSWTYWKVRDDDKFKILEKEEYYG